MCEAHRPLLFFKLSIIRAAKAAELLFRDTPGLIEKVKRVFFNVAPPLDGIWATAPYFHNGSVPTVYDVLSYLAAGMSIEEILDDFPYLTRDDILACLAWAADRERHTLMKMA